MDEKKEGKTVVVKIDTLINKVVVIGNDVDYEKIENEIRKRISSVLNEICEDFTKSWNNGSIDIG